MSNIKLWHEPTTAEDAYTLAETVAQSGICPPALRSPSAVFTAMAYGAELGFSPMASLRGINVIQGVPSLGADMMVAVVRQRGDVTQWDYDEMTESRCSLTARRGEQSPITISWTLDQASRVMQKTKHGTVALTDKDTWQNYPRQMLKHRVDAEVCRALWSDIILGFHTPDEVESIQATATPVQPARQLAELPTIQATPQLPETVDEPEAHMPLTELRDVGEGKAAKIRKMGVSAPAELYAYCQEHGRPSWLYLSTVQHLEELFAKPAEPDKPDKYVIDLRDIGDDQALWSDAIVGDLVVKSIAASEEEADQLFGDAMDAAYDGSERLTVEDFASVWRGLVEG